MVRSADRDLAASVAENAPRVLAVFGPPGYGKGALVRAYARYADSLVVCDLGRPADAADLTRTILDALLVRDRSRAARSAAGRLAQRPDLVSATTREALRREWPLAQGSELFVLRDVGGALATPAGVDLVAELIGSLPSSRTLAITTRTQLPPALSVIVERDRSTTVGPDELALLQSAVVELAQAEGLSPGDARTVYEVARGWPLVSRLLIGLARDFGPAELADAACLPAEALLSFAAQRTIARLGADLRDALGIASVLRGATHADLVRVLGEGLDDLLFARLAAIPFVYVDHERAIVHPEIVGLLWVRFESQMRSLYERALQVLSGDGAYVKAAAIAIQRGDVLRAAAILDAAPPYTAARVPLAEYERLLDHLERELVTRYPNVWLATIPYRAFSVDRATYVREAETVYYCLPRTASPEQRAVVLIHLASAYANVGRLAETDRILEDALQGFAREPSTARATLLTFWATLRGIDGRFSEARELAQEAVTSAAPDFVFGENQTLHYINAHEAAFRGRYETALVIFDELVRRLSREELPLYLAYAATNGALIAWVAGDDVRFQQYLSVLEDHLTPGIERGFAPMVDAARGRPVHIDENYPWPVLAAIAHLYRIGEAGVDAEALEAACDAAAAADERGESYARLLSHAAIYVLDERAREFEAGVLISIVERVESPELQDAVRRLVRGEPAGILEPFVRLRIRRDRARRQPRIAVELLGGRVVRDGVPLKLTEKEFELITLLATAHGVVSKDKIGEALWDHLDPEEWPNNIKVTLSRLRSKLAFREAVQVEGGGYRLSPAIEVDLRRAESVTRQRAYDVLDDPTREALESIVSSYGSGASARYGRFAWMQPTLVRINDVACTAGLALARDALLAERYDDALAYARAVADIDSFNEAACETVVRVFIARGDMSAARREFRRYASALERELDAKPSERLATLVRVSA
jgi:DNA-binding SARP family transcriptional activator